MKNTPTKILTSLFLTAVYYFAMVVVSHATPSHESQSLDHHADSYFTNLTSNPFCHTTPVKSSVDVTNIYGNGLDENNQKSFDALPRNAAIHFQRDYKHYKHEPERFLVKYRIADLIFPFHYFW